MFRSHRKYVSEHNAQTLHVHLNEAFSPFGQDAQTEIKDESRPFMANYIDGKWDLYPQDSLHEKVRFHLQGKVHVPDDERESHFQVVAQASHTQKKAIFLDMLYGIVLTLIIAVMELKQDWDIVIVAASVPIMLTFVAWYIRNSSRKILNYRWEQLDNTLAAFATPEPKN